MNGNNKTEVQKKLARAVCLFLAEMLRTRQADLTRAADIAAAIVEKLEAIGTEEDFLKIIKQLEMDFQELEYLKRDLIFYQQRDERQYMEVMVREFAINNLPDEPQRAVSIMEQALLPNTTIDKLVQEFPDFHEFIRKNSEYYEE